MPARTQYGKWQARGYRGWGYDRRRVHLGNFDSEAEAARVEREWKIKRNKMKLYRMAGLTRMERLVEYADLPDRAYPVEETG